MKAGEEIAIGTATDPYQPAERKWEVTRSILEELARHRGLSIGIVTKSNLILRDVALLRELGKLNRVFVSLTITTLDVDLARMLEPRAPRPDLRMEAVRQLNLAGVSAGVNCAPVLPGITDSLSNLEEVVAAAAAAKARNIFANTLFLKPCAAAVFLPFLEQAFPHLVESYRKRYDGRAFLPPVYTRRVSEMMNQLRKKYGFHKPARQDRYEDYAMEQPPPVDHQMKLF